MVMDEDLVTKAFSKEKEVTHFVTSLSEGGPTMICGAAGAQKALLTALAEEKLGKPLVVVVPEEKDILRWEEDLSFFSPKLSILPFPVVEEAECQVTFSSTERLRDRMGALSALVSGAPSVILATAVEAAQKIPDRKTLTGEALSLETGITLDREEFLSRLVRMGYERVDQVERCGHFSVRGDIIDIFPVNEAHPVRLEFWGDDVDSMRFFDEDSQRSIAAIKAAKVFPLSGGYALDSSLFSYAGEGLILYDEPQRCQEQLRRYIKEEKENKKKCFSWEELTASAKGRRQGILSLLKQQAPSITVAQVETWNGQTMTNYQRQVPLFLTDLSYLLKEGWTVTVAAAKAQEKEDLSRLFRENGVPLSDMPEAGRVYVTEGLLTGGFELPFVKHAVIAASDIFGQPKLRRFRNAPKGQQIRYFSDLNTGDYVVQKTHGIGRYVGMKTIDIDGIHRDYLTIQYAGNDKLYLPMEKITTLEKYIGPEGASPALSKMGGVQWAKVEKKAKKSIENLAEKLVDVYAQREMARGIAFPPDTDWQREFEDAFPYVETPDQMTAIEAVKRAMERPQPMDMLLCGDVGFGKTEVAMRAVFKCVVSGYQAMVLVPTTVLSQQHGETFRQRMDHFGVRVEVLNRFCTAKEKKDILKRLERGEIDVLIGTHALLSKKVKFHKLGLLVVDEEQRFGVMQKEKWKSLASGIDVLTLSATPIPRTLHMSLAGVRDMTVINTPPANRHAIQTYVAEYDDLTVKEAILRERERGGQVYFVYNRIDSIDAMAEHLKKILPPDISIGIAYGRMDGDQLEDVMVDFYRGRYDVLLCTTLIENGLDQPNANTMLVYDADRLGLSQIYQMRGRVGRSEKIARAYFFYRKGKILSEVAEKRLDAIREFTELGSGFKIAMRDLEIRGAGNLLGAEQHGNMASIGFAAYCSMLDEAITRIKAERAGKPLPRRLPATVIEFRQDAYIDKGYIAKEEQKIEIYRRLAMVENEKDLEDLLDEVIDRFGTPSAPVERLFASARLRVKARALGVGSISDEGDSYLITWADTDLLGKWNPGSLPSSYMKALRILPSVPVRVRINKAVLPKDGTQWLSAFFTEMAKEVKAAG